MPDYRLGPLYLYVEDESLYMESGYLSNISVGPCTDDAARPAVLNYTGSETGYVNSTSTPLQGHVSISTDDLLDEFPFDGEALLDGSESLAVGCALKLDSVEDQCGNTHEGGGFCPIDVIVRKKKVMSLVPPSMFSGKLRMMIQAIYGSKRTDINTVEVETFVVPGKLELAGFQLSCFYSPSYGLFTAPGYQYFLVEVTNDIKYYPILITDKAQALVDILVDHPRNNEPDFVKKVEAYILSTATIDEDNVIVGGSLTGLEGEPLSYGWHWSWDGHTADIVLHVADYTNHWYNTARRKLAITYVDGVFGQTLTTEESGHWWPQFSSGIHVFFPNYFANKAEAMVPVRVVGEPVPDAIGVMPVSPLHCYRSASDELVVARYSSNMYAGSGAYLNLVDGCSGETWVYNSSGNYGGLQGSNSFSLGDVTHTGTVSQITGKAEWTVHPTGPTLFEKVHSEVGNIYPFLHEHYMCGGQTVYDYLISTGYFGPPGPFEPISTGTFTVFIDGEEVSGAYGLGKYHIPRYVDGYTVESEVRFNTPIFLQLPFNDCSSVLWGNRNYSSDTGKRNSLPDYPENWQTEGISIWQFYYLDNVWVPISEVVPMVERYGSFIPNPGTESTGTDTLSYIGEVSLHRNDGSDELIYTTSSGSPLGSYFDMNPYDYPFVDQLDWVLEDTGDGYKFSYKSTLSSDTAYPGDCSVGWV